MSTSKWRSALKMVLGARKIWKVPRRAPTVIFDRSGSDLFLRYLDPKEVEIFDNPGEAINLFLLFRCLLRNSLSLPEYCKQFFSIVKPRVVLTYIDNSILFSRLKRLLGNVVTIFVQNGIRAESGDIFDALKARFTKPGDFHVDHMLTFGSAVGREFQKYVSGNILPIGSFKNNLFSGEKRGRPDSVLFVSQFRPPPTGSNGRFFLSETTSVSWEAFFSAERMILPFLHDYCQKKNLELLICMISPPPAVEEAGFFHSVLGVGAFRLLPKMGPLDSYDKIRDAGMVVTIDSTLGYESLAAGKRTAVFSIREALLGIPVCRFGWPADLPPSGPFWTNIPDEGEFHRVMDDVSTDSQEAFGRSCRKFLSEVIEFDPGNARFLALMREVGVALRSPSAQSY